MKPRTTIVVTQRERFTPTAHFLDGILARTGTAARTIFVDGGSPRRCGQWLDAAASRLDFTLLRAAHCLAPSEARDAALPLVDTEFVAFVDNDVTVSEGWLASLERTAEETGAWVVGPLYLHGYPSGTPEHPRIHTAGGRCRIVDHDGNREFESSMDHYDQPAADVWPTERFATELLEYHCALARTDVMLREGMHDVALRSGHDQQDLGLKVQAQGGECWLEPEAWVLYERPRRLSFADRQLYILRWGNEWDVPTLDHFYASWDLDPSNAEYAESLHWHAYSRRRNYLPATTIPQRVRRKVRTWADAPTQRIAARRDARRRRHPGVHVAHAASWLEASPRTAPTY